MRDTIGLAALVILVGLSWSTSSVALLGVGGALTFLLCWDADR